MIEFGPADRTYFDSEEIAEFIRTRTNRLAALPFNHDNNQELPLRSDVWKYVRNRLFRAESGLITAGGLPLPDVQKGGDGTLSVTWSVEDRFLNLWVPCYGVAVLERYTTDADTYLAFTLHSEVDPLDFDEEVETGFTWLEGEES